MVKLKIIQSLVLTMGSFGLLLGFYLNKPEKKNFEESGKPYNEVRKNLAIPAVEDTWIPSFTDSSGVTWKDKFLLPSQLKARHLSKYIRFREGLITSEEDAYDRLVNDSTDNRVIYVYNFQKHEWNCRLIIHHYRSYPPLQGKQLTLPEADSILAAWGLSRK